MTRTGFPQVLHAEWIKVRSVRSTAWALLAGFGLTLLFTALVCSSTTTEGGSPGRPGDNDIVRDSLAGVWLGQIAFVLLAVLVIASEYSTGTIRATFAANPRRRLVLGAKAALLGGLVVAAGFLTAAASFVVGQSLAPRKRVRLRGGLSRGDPDGRAGAAGSRRHGPVPDRARAAHVRDRSDRSSVGGGDQPRARARLRPDHRDRLSPGERRGARSEALTGDRGACGPADGRALGRRPPRPVGRAGRPLRLRSRRARDRLLADPAPRRLQEGAFGETADCAVRPPRTDERVPPNPPRPASRPR